MRIESFVEKAIEGGWNGEQKTKWHNALGHDNVVCPATVLLDPEAWKAVGKAEGWWDGRFPILDRPPRLPDWHMHMRGMVDALAEGKTVEQYLETL